MWIYTSTTQFAVMAQCLVRDSSWWNHLCLMDSRAAVLKRCKWYIFNILLLGRSQWPLGLRHELSSLGSWVRIPLKAWMYILCVYVVLYVGRGLATGRFLVQGVPPTVYRIKKLKSGQGTTCGFRAIVLIIYCYRTQSNGPKQLLCQLFLCLE
jgi:hypothetical protein